MFFEIFSEEINAIIFGPPIGRGPPRIAGSAGSVVTPLDESDPKLLSLDAFHGLTMTQICGGGRPTGELTTLPKTPSWRRERLRAGKGKMGRKGEKGKVRDGKGREEKIGERVWAQPPRGGTGGEVNEWVGVG